MSIPGLQGYQGDSEISDSDGELSPDRSNAAPVPGPVISGIGLGIPLSQPIRPSPPPFTKPVVRSAPSITLVNYERDDDDDMDMSMDQEGLVKSEVIIRLSKPHPPIHEVVNSVNNSPSPPESLSSSDSDSDTDPFFLPLDDVELPPAPDGVCPQSLQDKLISLLETKNRLGKNPFDQIVKTKTFRNPSIYEKLIQLCGVNEFGTNYPQEVFNPNEWTQDDMYDKLSEAQKKAHEMKMRARAERSKIEFKSGTKLPQQPAAAVPTQELKRKTKWDEASDSGGSKSAGQSPVKKGNLPVGAQALINARVISKADMLKLMKK